MNVRQTHQIVDLDVRRQRLHGVIITKVGVQTEVGVQTAGVRKQQKKKCTMSEDAGSKPIKVRHPKTPVVP